MDTEKKHIVSQKEGVVYEMRDRDACDIFFISVDMLGNY